MTHRCCAVLIAVVLSLAACGSERDGPVAAQGAAGHPVLLDGYVGLFGGPLNPKTGAMALQDSPAAQVAVAAEAGAVTVARIVTGSDGRFTLRLAPGRYLIKADCGAGARVVVHDKPLRVRIRCDVK
jgi:hypothetical protein